MGSNNSVTPNIKPRDWDFDGFFVDEFHAVGHNLDTQCVLDRFSNPSNPGDPPTLGIDTKRQDFKNPLEDSKFTSVVEVTKGNPEAGIDWSYWIYTPPKLHISRPKPVKLSIFFGPPGPVMNRQGLRAYFESSDHVLITLPGTENRPKFGVGITPAMIDTLLTLVMDADMGTGNWTIDVLAAYSTGCFGMNSTINNLLKDSHLINISKLIYYDCLYRHDAPKPGQNTFHAMEKVLKNSPAAKFIIYELTGTPTDDPHNITGGTPRRTNGDYWTAWPANADPRSSTNTVTTVNNLKAQADSNALLSLGVARLIEGALEDGYFDRAFLKSTFKNGAFLIDVVDNKLQARGSYASSQAMATAGKTFVGSWLTTAETTKLAVLASQMFKPIFDNKKFKLLGWIDIPGLLDIVHDTHVPEFAWEHLVG